jgi:hypothetical protein
MDIDPAPIVADTGKVKHCWRTMMEESYIIKVYNISPEYEDDDSNEMDLYLLQQHYG